jgi:hypothetical protein
MGENSDFTMKINEINVELSGNSQRYVNECCESESDGKIDGFGAGCCKCRGGGHCWHVVVSLLQEMNSGVLALLIMIQDQL